MKYYVTMPGVVYADRIMVQSENMRKIYIEKLTEFAGEETKDVWEQRVRVLNMSKAENACNAFGAVCNQENRANHDKNMDAKKRMLYGIGLGAYIEDVEEAKSKIKRNLMLFEEHKSKIDLSVWVFPENADELGEYIDGELQNYSGKRLDDEAECNPLDYDAYYGDAMPLVMKFRDANKPVMIQAYDLAE